MGLPVLRLANIQCQHLVQRLLVGNQADAHEFPARFFQDAVIHGQPPTDGGISVIAQAPGIGHGDQEQVKGCCAMAAAVDVVVMDQPLIDPAELFGDFADTLRANRMFGYHGGLLCKG